VSIRVRNKLEVRPGGVIAVPGCEPVSSLTGTALLEALDCNASIIPLEDALTLIPGSRVVRTLLPGGQNGTGLFFELPEGPPPDGNECGCRVVDYYQILRDNARVPDQEEAARPPGICEGFNTTGCQLDQHFLKTSRDPNLRPNSNPLSAL
jgi:hypothetical protein